MPYLLYFRRGEFARIAAAPQYAELGGWETFGKLVTYCRTDDCKSCIQTLSKAVDKTTSHHNSALLATKPLWKSIQQRPAKPADPLLQDMPVQNTTLQ